VGKAPTPIKNIGTGRDDSVGTHPPGPSLDAREGEKAALRVIPADAGIQEGERLGWMVAIPGKGRDGFPLSWE